MPGEERTPVVVGVAQLSLREEVSEQASEPIAMLERVAWEAAEDAGQRDRLLHSLDCVAIVNVIGWRALPNGDSLRRASMVLGNSRRTA